MVTIDKDFNRSISITDNIGNVRLVVRDSANYHIGYEHYDQTPFGDSTLTYSGKGSRFSYGAKELNPENGYFKMGARLYDPAIGRFLSRDPLAELFPNHSSYSYAFNSPLNFNDPTGLAPETEKGDKLQAGLDFSMIRNMQLVEGVSEFTQYETTYHEEYVSTKSSNPLKPTGRWVLTGTTTTTRLGTAGGDIRSKGADDGGGGGPGTQSAGRSGVTNPNIDYLYVGYESETSRARVNVDGDHSDAVANSLNDMVRRPGISETMNNLFDKTVETGNEYGGLIIETLAGNNIFSQDGTFLHLETFLRLEFFA